MSVDPTKGRLLEAAGEEFAEHGYDAATIRAICKKAGANVAAINYHFGGKEPLYVQAVMAAHRCGVDLPVEIPVFDEPPADQLRRYVRHFLEHVLSLNVTDTWHQKLMLREMVRPSAASATLVREVIRPKFERLMAILREACPDADEPRLHASAFSIVGQCLHYKMARPMSEMLIGREAVAKLDLDFLANHIADFSLAGLGLGPDRGPDGNLTAAGGRSGEK